MARYTGAVCRLCRREGLKLFLKGERCYTDKCAIERRNYPPGPARPGAREVLRVRDPAAREAEAARIYGVLEGQFRRYFQMAERAKGVTGETLLQLLERRLDNMVYRMGFATSRAEARQLVRHGHFQRQRPQGRTSRRSCVKAGDVVAVRERSRKVVRIQEALELAQRRGVPEWLEVDRRRRSPGA